MLFLFQPCKFLFSADSQYKPVAMTEKSEMPYPEVSGGGYPTAPPAAGYPNVPPGGGAYPSQPGPYPGQPAPYPGQPQPGIPMQPMGGQPPAMPPPVGVQPMPGGGECKNCKQLSKNRCLVEVSVKTVNNVANTDALWR